MGVKVNVSEIEIESLRSNRRHRQIVVKKLGSMKSENQSK